jgi:hypothetical protein
MVVRYLQRRSWPLRFCDLLLLSQFTAGHLCGELALDESKGLGAVLVDVLLVRVGIVAVAAVWVGGVAVRLDDGGAGGCALESRRTGGKLKSLLAEKLRVERY